MTDMFVKKDTGTSRCPGLKNMPVRDSFTVLLLVVAAGIAHANPATKLAFSSAPKSIPINTCAAIDVVTINNLQQATAVTKNTTVVTDQGGGKIAFFNNSSCTAKSSSFVIPAGSSSGRFYISGTALGAYSIRVSAQGLESQLQTETIVAATSTAPPATDCAGPQSPPNAPPSQAANNGFNNLVFDDEFNSVSTIYPNPSGPYNWYVANFYSASASLPATGYQVNNGCLTILTDASGYSDGLATADPTYPTRVFQHGYFEASIRFNPKGSQGSAWPAFWSYAIEAVEGNASPYAELDFMEAYPQGTAGVTLLTTIHEWTKSNGSSSSVQQPNDVPTLPKGTDFSQFHTYGCLWTTNSITWYFDNQPVMTVATGPGTAFTAIEQDHMFLILGTGKNWPMTVDYVHVWQ